MSASPRAARTDVGLIYLTGLAQGLALVTFPAASSVFTSRRGYRFSSTRCGGSVLAPSAARDSHYRFGTDICKPLEPEAGAGSWSSRRPGCKVAARFKQLADGSPDAAFRLLLVTTGALGFGFGATVMVLNTSAQDFFSQRSDRAVLALNALLGTGTGRVGASRTWLTPKRRA